ncbi:MAG: thioredoxin-disulfide reductase [Candidatus Humimicrobiaceae bacterium]
MKKVEKDLLIIGAGPAGLGAALYAKRAGVDFKIVEKYMAGGQITNTEFIENYLGFKEKISGFDLVKNFVEHCKKLGIKIEEYTNIESVEPVDKNNGKIFKCKVFDKEDLYEVKSIIIATGASPKMLHVKGEKELIGSGISFCATCDGALYKDKEVAVVGGGDTAIEEALFLAKFAKKVYIIHRRDELRAVNILQERAFGNNKIKILWGSVIEEFIGKERLQKIKVRNKKEDKSYTMNIDGVFEYVGYKPNAGLAKDLVDSDNNGFIITDRYMRTSFKGIYAAGDVRSTALRQVITAVSDGAVAATSLDKQLRGLL